MQRGQASTISIDEAVTQLLEARLKSSEGSAQFMRDVGGHPPPRLLRSGDVPCRRVEGPGEVAEFSWRSDILCARANRMVACGEGPRHA